MLSTIHSPRSLSRFRPFHTLRPLSSTTVAAAALTDQSSPSTSSSGPPQSQILSIRHSLLTRELTATQLAESYLERIRFTEPQLNSFLHISDSVLKNAQHLDEKISRNEELGPLAGVLVGVKDNICTSDMPSTGGSRILENYRPPFDATAVRRLKDLGGIVVGKTNLDEFGMGSTTEGSAYKVCTSHSLEFFVSKIKIIGPSKNWTFTWIW